MPNNKEAFVEDAKLGYLLRAEDKGGVFLRLGFSHEEVETLRQALLEHARTAWITKEERNPYGVKYVVEGRLRSPDRRDPSVSSVWIVERSDAGPRFVTAYPDGGEE